MPKVSIYPNIKIKKDPTNLEVVEIFDYIKSDNWRDKITVLRQMVADNKPAKEIEKYKCSLPYFTGSGTFTERKLDDPNFVHSGKMIIDFDKIETYTTIEAARAQLLADKFTEYLFLSCTGRGFAVVVNIDPKLHLDSFLFLEKYYKEKYNLTIDKSCKDYTRARYISYDPDLFFNPNAVPVTIPVSGSHFELQTDEPITAPVHSMPLSESIDTDDEKYEWCKGVVSKKENYIEGNRHHFVNVLVFFLNKAGVSFSYASTRVMAEYSAPDKDPKELMRQLNAAYTKIDEHATFKINKSVAELPPEFADKNKKIFIRAMNLNEAGRKIGELENEIISVSNEYNVSPEMVRGIFTNVFKKYKDRNGLDDAADVVKVEFFIKDRYDLVKNEITHRIEGKLKDENGPYEIVNVDEISRELATAKFKFPLDRLKSLLRSKFVAKYNPFRTYFESTGPVDESTDWIELLADHVKTDRQDFWKIQFKKALVRCIACSLEAGKVNRIIMTLVGEKEETGKSSFINFLCPPALSDYYTEEPIDNSKDSQIALSENFIWNFEELASLNAMEANRFKATISKISIKQRKAYGEFSEANPRRVNFWAATNKTDFLTDDQNTRWLCFEVKEIDFDYNNIKTGVKNVDINKVWAQAWHLYKSGFDYRLSSEEMEIRKEMNKGYESDSIEKACIKKLFKPSSYPFGRFVSNGELMIILAQGMDHKFKFNIYAVSRAMRQLDFQPIRKKINKNVLRGYLIDDVTAFDKNDDHEIIPDKKIF